MNIDHDDEDDGEAGNGHDYSPVDEIDLFGAAIALCQVAQRAKTIEAALKRLRKIGRDTLVAEQKLAGLEARAADTAAALAEREAELAARASEIERRETELAASIEEARDNLRAYYDRITEVDRHLRWRVLNHADLLHGYNAQLQDLPDWPVIRRMVAGLPPDPPPLERDVAHPRIDALSDTFSDPNADRHGNVFLGTLTRSTSHKVTSQ
jgi:hypothetical protein